LVRIRRSAPNGEKVKARGRGQQWKRFYRSTCSLKPSTSLQERFAQTLAVFSSTGTRREGGAIRKDRASCVSHSPQPGMVNIVPFALHGRWSLPKISDRKRTSSNRHRASGVFASVMDVAGVRVGCLSACGFFRANGARLLKRAKPTSARPLGVYLYCLGSASCAFRLVLVRSAPRARLRALRAPRFARRVPSEPLRGSSAHLRRRKNPRWHFLVEFVAGRPFRRLPPSPRFRSRSQSDLVRVRPSPMRVTIRRRSNTSSSSRSRLGAAARVLRPASRSAQHSASPPLLTSVFSYRGILFRHS